MTSKHQEPLKIGATINTLRARYVKSDRDGGLKASFDALLARDDDDNPLPFPSLDGSDLEARGLLVYGESGAGKTTAIAHMLRTHPLFPDSGLGYAAEDDRLGSVLRVRVRSPATLKSFGRQTLERTGYFSMRLRATGPEIWDKVRFRFKELGIRVVWFDEAQDVSARSGGEDVLNCNTFKTLITGRDAVLLVLSGVPELDRLVGVDRQLDRRLDRFPLDRLPQTEGAAKIMRLCVQYAKDAGGMQVHADDTHGARIVFAAHDQFGTSIELIRDAVANALRAKSAFLTLDHFAHVYLKRTGCLVEHNPFIAPDFLAIKRSTDPETELPAKGGKPKKSAQR